MHLRPAVFLLLLTVFIPAAVFAAADDSDIAAAGGFSLSIDGRVGVNAFGIVPGIPVMIGVPMSITDDSVTLTPQFGFIYYFDVLTDYHNPYYVPVGLSALYNPIGVGLDFMYYPAVGGTNTNHLMSVSAVSEVEIFSAGAFSLNFELKLGPMFILDPDGWKTFVSINSVFIPRYTL